MATIFWHGYCSNLGFWKSRVTTTHPELLDWLAVTFVEEGWDIKDDKKNSHVYHYQQSSKSNGLQLSIDPKNQYLSVFQGKACRDDKRQCIGK